MAVKGCLLCIKYLVLFLNFIFLLAGIGVLAVSVWMYLDTKAYLAGNTDEKIFISIYILMAAGSLMAIIGFLGCCGAMQESSCVLGTFSTLVLLVFAAEVGGAVYAWKNQDEVKEAFSKRLEEMIKNEYGLQEGVTFAVDAMQKKLECCGANGVSDWADSAFKNKRGEVGKVTNSVPPSCCNSEVEGNGCALSSTLPVLNALTKGLYTEGCFEKLQKVIEQHISIIIAVGLGVAVVQILGFICSLVLCCAISNSSAY